MKKFASNRTFYILVIYEARSWCYIFRCRQKFILKNAANDFKIHHSMKPLMDYSHISYLINYVISYDMFT